MSVPPIPAPLEDLGQRPFSFYPPILSIQHNEWKFLRSTWSEMLVVNTKSGMEVWIPRRFLGEISRVDEPVMIMGLNRELEYNAGSVWPTQQRVIEMPKAGPAPASFSGAAPEQLAPVVGISLGSSTEKRIGRLIGMVLLALVLVTVVFISFSKFGPLRPRITYTAGDTAYLELHRDDDYFAVLRKLGEPGGDRWRSETGELQYRVLEYPGRGYSVILMGSERNSARFIGVMDENWRPIHFVEFSSGGTTASMLRGLPRF
jgi:hypothetical protein